jgi:hypothetical protein
VISYLTKTSFPRKFYGEKLLALLLSLRRFVIGFSSGKNLQGRLVAEGKIHNASWGFLTKRRDLPFC